MTLDEFLAKYLGKSKGYPDDSQYKGECLSIVKLYIKECFGINPPPSGTNSASSGSACGGGGGGAGNGGDGANGGSGVVIIRYLTSGFGNCTGGTKSTDGLYTVHKFTSSGTFLCKLLSSNFFAFF